MTKKMKEREKRKKKRADKGGESKIEDSRE